MRPGKGTGLCPGPGHRGGGSTTTGVADGSSTRWAQPGTWATSGPDRHLGHKMAGRPAPAVACRSHEGPHRPVGLRCPDRCVFGLPDAVLVADRIHLANDMLTAVRLRVTRERNGRRGGRTTPLGPTGGGCSPRWRG